MQFQNDRHPWNVRALLESTATPFAIVDYRPRTAIFLQGDSCDSVMHIERVVLLLATVAAFAAYFPARRAMRVDPIVALRYE